MTKQFHLEHLAKRIRFLILKATTTAGSGHPSSSLSATDLMTTLLFGGFFKSDLTHPDYPNNDRLIFSKGHAAPLLYALYVVAGRISEKEILTLRTPHTRLEGHPSMRFPYTEAPTGSLGQGLSIGVGMALHAKYIGKLRYTTYVLLGDSEMAEGQIWEAIQLAAHYQLNNLVGIIDVNRLGQRGNTMYGHNINAYEKQLQAFGWQTISIDGHTIPEIQQAFARAQKAKRPCMIIAKTIKGKGISFIENKNGWHGKVLTLEQLKNAQKELGDILPITGAIRMSSKQTTKKLKKRSAKKISYTKGECIAPRVAYGNALARLYVQYPNLVVLDAEVSNSTKTDIFKRAHPDRFFEMFIAEQNMVSAGVGLARRGNIVSVNSFAAFLARACDQIRMSQYADVHMLSTGSHAGVSIGPDGFSQMGLQDMSLFRSLTDSVVLYPADAVATEQCTHQALRKKGLYYIRTTRMKLPVLYNNSESFPIGKSKTLRQSSKDTVTIIAAGVTVHEALKAYQALQKKHISVRVIDAYSVKPIDNRTIKKAARQTNALLTVEDHVAEGGLADAVRSVFTKNAPHIISLAVTQVPQSGSPEQLLHFEKIDARAILQTVKKIIQR